jgi:DNA-binding NarL/FixJ family response regulator
MRQLRLLFVEDHPLIVQAVKLALGKSADFEVVATTSSGREVVALAEQLEPDLILLDLGLPGLDGVEVLRALRRAGNEIPRSSGPRPRTATSAHVMWRSSGRCSTGFPTSRSANVSG